MRLQAEIGVLLVLILFGSLGMWYIGSQYLFGGGEATLENTGENSAVGGWGGGSGSGTGDGSVEEPSTPHVEPTEISFSAKLLLVFIAFGIMVGAGIGMLIARIRLISFSRTEKVKVLKSSIKEEILEYISQRVAFTVSELAELTNVSERKIERYVKKLVKRGIVKLSDERGSEQVYIYAGKR